MDDQDLSTDELDRLSPLKVLERRNASASAAGISSPSPQSLASASVTPVQVTPPVSTSSPQAGFTSGGSVTRDELLQQAASVSSAGFILPTMEPKNGQEIPVNVGQQPGSMERPQPPAVSSQPLSTPPIPSVPSTPPIPAGPVQATPVVPPNHSGIPNVSVSLSATPSTPIHPNPPQGNNSPTVPGIAGRVQTSQASPAPIAFPNSASGTTDFSNKSGKAKKIFILALVFILIGGTGTVYGLVLQGTRIPYLYKTLSGLNETGVSVNQQALAYLNTVSGYSAQGSVNLFIPESDSKPELPTTQQNGTAGEVYSLKSEYTEGGFWEKGKSYIGRAKVTINDSATPLDTALYVGNVSSDFEVTTRRDPINIRLASVDTSNPVLALESITAEDSTVSPDGSVETDISDEAIIEEDISDETVEEIDDTDVADLESTEVFDDSGNTQIALAMTSGETSLPGVVSVAEEDAQQTALYPILRPLSLEAILETVRGERSYTQKKLSDGTKFAQYTFDGDEQKLAAYMPRNASLSDILITGAYAWKGTNRAAAEPQAVTVQATLAYKGKKYTYQAQWRFGNWNSEPVLNTGEGPTLTKNPTTEEVAIDDLALQLGILSIDALPNTLYDDYEGGDTTGVDPGETKPVATPSPTTIVVPTGEGVTSIQPVLTNPISITYSQVTSEATRTRDEQRAKDLMDLATALNAYKSVTGSYPVAPTVQQSGSSQTLLTALVPKYITKIPVDPLKNSYWYGYVSNGTTFRLTSVAENANATAAKKGSTFYYLEITNN